MNSKNIPDDDTQEILWLEISANIACWIGIGGLILLICQSVWAGPPPNESKAFNPFTGAPPANSMSNRQSVAPTNRDDDFFDDDDDDDDDFPMMPGNPPRNNFMPPSQNSQSGANNTNNGRRTFSAGGQPDLLQFVQRKAFLSEAQQLMES